tara:strand:- start:4088 stop:4903 length:816 start_codon:yes stop_codon:yes gene_type:complete
MHENNFFQKIKRNCYYFLRKIVLIIPNLFFSKKNHKYLFILSPPFCGSTLLNQIISSSKNVSCNNNIGTREGQTLPGVKKIMFDQKRWDEKNKLPWNKIKKIWRLHWFLKKPILLDKSIPNIMRVNQLKDFFHPSYFICMVRNPYAICEGVMRRSNKSALEAAKFTIKCFIYQMQNNNNHKDIIFFSYEDLCDNTTNTITKIKTQIGELYDINPNQKFKAHNFKTKKSMCITNLNNEKIKKIKKKDLIVINKHFNQNKKVLDFFNYKIISY